MSGERAEPARQPVSVSATSRRRLEERFVLRFPAAFARFAALVLRLPPRSRFRRTAARRAVKVGTEAYNRGDFDVYLVFFHPDFEYVSPRQLIGLGFEPVYRGREARIAVGRKWNAEWGEFHFLPEELIDAGDRALVIGRMKGSGSSSGLAVDNDWADLFWFSAGRVIREQPFLDRAEALEAAGLSEQA